jgi:hypothetical protein
MLKRERNHLTIRQQLTFVFPSVPITDSDISMILAMQMTTSRLLMVRLNFRPVSNSGVRTLKSCGQIFFLDRLKMTLAIYTSLRSSGGYLKRRAIVATKSHHQNQHAA